MRPLHLNLASRPYRDYRPVYAVVVVASLLIAFLMLNNIDTYYRYLRQTRDTRDDIASIEAQIAQERRRADVATNQMRGIDLQKLSRQTRFINAQLAERAFSWSELLARLEEVVPSDVRILSVAPVFNDNGLVTLNMTGEAKESDGMTALLNRFQRHPSFQSPFPRSETHDATGFKFGMTVDYKPSIPRPVLR